MERDTPSHEAKDKKTQLPGMAFTDRDGQVLKAIQFYGNGILARRHLQELLWSDKSKRAMDARLEILHTHSYLMWPTQQERRHHPIPEPIIWLGWRGALWLAEQQGIIVDPPKNKASQERPGENQLQIFETRLYKAGFRWVREPGWSILAHTIGITEVLLIVERAVRQLPGFVLEDVIQESVFRREKDFVEAYITNLDGRPRQVGKEVIPDLFVSIVDTTCQITNEPVRARLLLEFDCATHSNPKWVESKALPYATYIKSPVYKKRFGHNSGRWLVVTTGGVRMKNLMSQLRQKAETTSSVFWFTTINQIKTSQNMLIDPIWLRGDWRHDKSEPLFQLHSQPSHNEI